MLNIKNLTISSDNKVILNNINLNIQPKETHLLLGPNGAGKSTLLKRIIGYKENIKTDGEIFFENINITDKKIEEIARLRIFMSFQHPKSISGIKYSSFLREINKIFNPNNTNIFSETRKIFDEMAEKLNLNKDIYDRDLNTNLSGGELKKSELIQLAIIKPKLCLIDEIDSGLDIEVISNVANILKSLQKNIGFAMIIISHNENFIKHFDIDYVHVLKNGSLIYSGKKELVNIINNQGWNCNICEKYGINCDYIN